MAKSPGDILYGGTRGPYTRRICDGRAARCRHHGARAMKTASAVKYHAGALGLLGPEGRDERRPVPELDAWANAHGVVLPAAYREWAELGGGALLEKYSNCSKFHFDAPELATIDGQRGLLFERETQGNFYTVVLLD